MKMIDDRTDCDWVCFYVLPGLVCSQPYLVLADQPTATLGRAIEPRMCIFPGPDACLCLEAMSLLSAYEVLVEKIVFCLAEPV